MPAAGGVGPGFVPEDEKQPTRTRRLSWQPRWATTREPQPMYNWRPRWAEAEREPELLFEWQPPAGGIEVRGIPIPEPPTPVLFEPEEAPEIEDVPELPPEPTDTGPTAMEEMRRLRRRRGFRSTVLTSPQGVLAAPPVLPATLLGGA